MSENRILSSAWDVMRKAWSRDGTSDKSSKFTVYTVSCNTRQTCWKSFLREVVRGRLDGNVACSIDFNLFPEIDVESDDIPDDYLMKCEDCFKLTVDSIHECIQGSPYFNGRRRSAGSGGFLLRPASEGIAFLDGLLRSPKVRLCKMHASPQTVELPSGTDICELTILFEDLKLEIEYYRD